MKKALLLLAFMPLLTALAMPLKWTCNFPEASAQVFQVYQGETVTFEPTFRVNGKAVDLEIEGIYYQTNGMAESWWKLDGNTFGPKDDVGAGAYRFFVAAKSNDGINYRANGTLRMLPSPGFVPNQLPLPIHTLDFATIQTLNEPWASGEEINTAIIKSEQAEATANALQAFIFGDDCQLVSTNYDSKVHMPHLYLRFKIKDENTGETNWQVVWNEKTRWNHLFEEYLPTNYFTKNEIAAELEHKADRAWGNYDSHTGNFAPEGYTWISSPSIAIAGGMAYQRIATSESAVWVLESNGMVASTSGNTNGYFRISDDKGNAIFEITKGNERVVGATAGAVRTESIDGRTHLFITYNVQSAEHPKLEICKDLKAKDWQPEGESACPANVVWTGSSGAWVAEVYGKQAEPCLFVKGTYKQGAKDMIKSSAPVSFNEVVIDGVTYIVKVETMNGKKVLALE